MKNTIYRQTVLVVDDLRSNALALKKILEPEWIVQTAPDGDTALRLAVENPAPHLILLDIRMPGMDGYEVCRRLKRQPQTRDIPVIFITAMQMEKEEARGLDLGAVDYIVKPVCPSVIRARVRTHISLQQALAELALTNQALADLAARDPLTGLYNRRKLDENFRLEVERAGRYGRPFSAILFDIDHFKTVNDRYGHSAGDDVLVQMSAWLQAALRTTDIPGRWGGDEFLVLCPETGLDTALQLADRLRHDYEGYDFPGAVRLTASFGVAAHRSGRTDSDILQSADAALYRAKQGGRNRVEKEAL